MTALTIMFLLVYFFIEAVHDYFQEIKDSVKWHAASAAQSISLVAFMVICQVFELVPTLSVPRLIMSAFFIRWVMLDNVLNIIRGGTNNMFYVGTTAWGDRKFRKLADKIRMHPELFVLILKLIALLIIALL